MSKVRLIFARVCLATALAAPPLVSCDDDDEDDDVVDVDVAGTTRETAMLTPAEEVPPPVGAANATGSFVYQLTDATGVMTYTLTVMNLTGPATMAHIHEAPPGMPGPIVLPLEAPTTGRSTGTLTLTADQVARLKAGAFYVNVHTPMNPPGEVRAQLDGR
jgi:hypothetical protein